MVLRTYPTNLVADANVVAAATASGITALRLAQILARMSPEQIAGIKTHVLKPTSWGLSAADWREAFSIPASVTDQEIEAVMKWLDLETAAIAIDPGS